MGVLSRKTHPVPGLTAVLERAFQMRLDTRQERKARVDSNGKAVMGGVKQGQGGMEFLGL